MGCGDYTMVRATDAEFACASCGCSFVAPPVVAAAWAAAHWQPRLVAVHAWVGGLHLRREVDV